MSTRRNFLKTGVVFCSCFMLDRAHAQGGPAKLPVAVSGKKVKTIDVHAHCQFREAGALLGQGPFTFIGLPLKMREGTASPIRAVAVFGM